MAERKEIPTRIVEGREAIGVFKRLGQHYAEALLINGYSPDEAADLIFLLGVVSHMAVQETAYPDDGAEFRDERGLLPLDAVPNVELRIPHGFRGFGLNQLLVMNEGNKVIDKARPPQAGTQGELIISSWQNSHLTDAVIPGGFYSEYDIENGLVSDSSGRRYESYGDLFDAIGVN